MQFIDTHTHLFSEQFNEDRTAIVEAAIAAGVNEMYLPNIDEKSIEPMLQLSAQFPNNCFPMMGIHPCDVKENVDEQLQLVRDWHKKHSFIAVGEIGLDLYWDKSLLVQQQFAFSEQIKLAKELKLPIAIHVREAFDEAFDIVDQLNDENLTGVFHCFTGSKEQAQHILNYGGFMLGIGGVLTYKKSDLGEVLKDIDLKHLILETDSPYLAPVPNRGKRNESSYIPHIAQKLADVKEVAIEIVAEQTSINAKKLFNR